MPELIAHGKYDSVEFRILPERFGPDWMIMKAHILKQQLGSLTYAEAKEIWQQTPGDSIFFRLFLVLYYRHCRVDRNVLRQCICPMVQGETKCYRRSKHPDYIERSGYHRELMNCGEFILRPPIRIAGLHRFNIERWKLIPVFLPSSSNGNHRTYTKYNPDQDNCNFPKCR
jgi:hypothetical protein